MPPVMHPWLLGGLALIAIPILIHLWNRWRFRRVQWAAVDFLLESQRRNRRRLWLEELLLLLLRCGVVALVVLSLVRPRLDGPWAAWFSAAPRTHHIVVVDDSYSMAQRTPTSTSFAIAKSTLGEWLGQWARATGRQDVTVILASRPQAAECEAADLNQSSADSLRQIASGWEASNLAVSVAPALTTAEWMIENGEQVRTLIHVLSDFQAKDWPEEGAIPEALRRCVARSVVLDLVDVAPAEEPANLTIVDIKARKATATIGLPTIVDVRVRNATSSIQSSVPLTPTVNGRPLPATRVEAVPPRGESVLSFEVSPDSPGVHEITVELAEDALPPDNQRYLALEVVEETPVLVFDGSEGQRGSLFLSLALAPGGSASTGLEPRVRRLDEVPAESWSEYSTIFVSDIEEVSTAQAEALRAYVEQGGGLAIFLGPQVDAEKWNAAMGPAGVGLLPSPLGSRRQVEAPLRAGEGDLRPEPHPVFRVFEGERNSFLSTITIAEYWRWQHEVLPATTKILARHRDGAPLIVESAIGRGRVVVVSTTAGRTWNSWPQNPTYVVTMLLLQEYLAVSNIDRPEYVVGELWELAFDLGQFRRQVTIDRPAATGATIRQTRLAEIDGSAAKVSLGVIDRPGVYRVNQTAVDGRSRTQARAYNVDAAEGNLAKVSRGQIERQLDGIDYTYRSAQGVEPRVGETSFELKDALLGLLALVLVVEQFLGYRLSFHS